jgi:hypothetical protein
MKHLYFDMKLVGPPEFKASGSCQCYSVGMANSAASYSTAKIDYSQGPVFPWCMLVSCFNASQMINKQRYGSKTMENET